MDRRTLSLIVMAGAALALLWLAPQVFFIVFAGILVGVFLRGGGCWIADHLHLKSGWGIAIFLVLIVAFFGGCAYRFAPDVAVQAEEFTQQVPQAANQVGDWLRQYPFGDRLIERVFPRVVSTKGELAATSALTSTFGALGTFMIILFIGIYGALDPKLYRSGVRALVAPSLRPKCDEVLHDAADTLRLWLMAQLMSMTVVGVLTGVGLWAVGIPLAALLGLIAGLLAFVPIVGPIAAAVPGLLIAFPEGFSAVLWALGVYVGVQLLESNLITPVIQQTRVHLPAAIVLVGQMLFGTLFGVLGLMLATPLIALIMTLVDPLYVRQLEHETRPIGEKTPPEL